MKSNIIVVTKTGAMSENDQTQLKQDLESLGYGVAMVTLSPSAQPSIDIRIEPLPQQQRRFRLWPRFSYSW
jgi:hypothetical protein